MDLKDEEFIKKSKLSYLKCTEGDLHEGQQMTLVCVETKCPRKGLICPVCRMNEHEDHKTIPLKVFLTQIRDKFLDQKNQNNESSLNSLSDYLRQMDNIRQQLLTVLRDTVTLIAEKVKKVEQQIFENYSNIRKLVLTQSTISTKLPGLINLMLDPKDRDSKEMQQEFRKYASLLVYEKDGIDFLDNSKKIVEEYSQLPSTVNIHLSTLIPSLTKIFDSLPLNLEKPPKAPVVSFTLNEAAKAVQIKLSADQKQAYIEPGALETGGYVIVKEGKGVEHQTIAFRVVSTDSGCISLGLAIPDTLKNKNYILEQMDANHGLFCISAAGFTYQHNNVDKQENDNCFPFGTGDTIDVTWNSKTKKIDFARRHGVEKYTIDVNLPDSDLAKLQFCIGIFGEGDKVAIVE